MKPLLPILALAALVRLWGLPDQPVLYFDSGQYLGEARFLSTATRAAFIAMVQPGSGNTNPVERAVKAAADGTEAHPPDNAKIGHAILLAVSMLLLGTSAFAAVLVSALTAIATVAATYAVGLVGWGRRIAIPAAMLLAISGWHLTYSREAYAEADTILFATLGCLVYLRSIVGTSGQASIRTYLFTGTLFGLAFTCNTRASYLPLLLVPTELLALRACGWRAWPRLFKRAVTFTAGWLAPLALIEGVYLGARALGCAFATPPTWPDYAQQLAAYWQQHPVTIRWDQWPSFLVDLAILDGIPLLCLVAVGVVAALVRLRQPQDILLLTALLLPVALYSVYVAGAVRMRAFSLALPWIMLAAALGLGALARTRPQLVAVATAALVLLAVPRDFEILSTPNGMPALLGYLEQTGVTDVASTDGAVLSFYIGEDHTNAKFRAAYINSLDDLAQLSQRYQLVAVEMQGYLFPSELPRRYLEAQPVFKAPHGSPILYLASILENRGVSWGEWSAVLDEWQQYRAAATELRLEDIRQLVGH